MLSGRKSNRSAVGARVTLTSAAGSQMEEIKAGSSYLSTSDPRLHFGLAGDSVIDKVEIRWPNGSIEILRNLGADNIYTIVEGHGVTSTVKLAPTNALADGQSGKPASSR